MTVQGFVKPGFESVQSMFKWYFESGSENECQLCVYLDQELVIDLWGSSKGNQDYNGDSLQNVFSSTKTLVSICVASLVDQGLISYEDKVVKHWPEFGSLGKEDIRLCDVLRHESGLVNLSEKVMISDLSRDAIKENKIGSKIEKTEMRLPPEKYQTKRAYHSISRGWILNEIFRRVEPSARTVGEFLRDEIKPKLNADVNIGLDEDQLKLCHDVVTWSFPYIAYQSLWPEWTGRRTELNAAELYQVMKLFTQAGRSNDGVKPPVILEGLERPRMEAMMDVINKKEVRMGEIPSINGSCSARGLAKVAACMANGGQLNGVRILSEKAVQEMQSQVITAKDFALMGVKTSFSKGGVAFYEVHEDDHARRRSINEMRSGFRGWHGLGGSVMQWHQELKIGFSFTNTLMHWPDFENARAAKLQAEVVKCVRRMRSNL